MGRNESCDGVRKRSEGVKEGQHQGVGQEQAWRPPQERMEERTGSKMAPQKASVMGEVAAGLLCGCVNGGQRRV